MKTLLITIALVMSSVAGCFAAQEVGSVVSGDERLPEYIHLLQGKRVGVLTSYTATVGGTHIVDTLLKSGVEIKRIFAPEGGFDEEKNMRPRNSYFGIEIVTLNQPPKANDVFACDVVVCDIQSIGTRECPSVVALGQMMQVCADIAVPLVVLDRPNPLGCEVDGAVVEPKYRTEGELPLPLLYGMTLGELARMANGEGWLSGGAKCPLTVVPCIGYSHTNEVCSQSDVPAAGLSEELPIVVAEQRGVNLSPIVDAYRKCEKPEEFFVGEEFDRFMGVEYVSDMITLGYSAEEIRSMWRADVERFVAQRKAYLIYEN